VSGTAQVRIMGPEASPQAPLTLAVGYKALAALGSSVHPDLVVPFSVRLDQPTRIDVARSVLDAVVASARSTAGRSFAESVPDLVGGAVRDGVGRAKQMLEGLP
jgi:hypothetical protein